MFPAIARQRREIAIERTYTRKEVRKKTGKQKKLLKNGGKGAGLA
jgi:hypothetical protein